MKNWNILFISVLLTVLLFSTMVVFAVEEENNSGDYSYVFNEDGSIKITKYTGDPVSKEIVVPNEIDGIKVTAIGRAFQGLVDTERIVLPDTIREIGESSFEYCTKLSDINIPASVETIGANPFMYCAISHYNLEYDNKYFKIEEEALIEKETGRLISFPKGDKSHTTFSVPDDVRIIGSFAFCECDQLRSIELNDGLTELQDHAFYHACFPEITVPESVTRIGNYAFSACIGLSYIMLPPNVEHLYSTAFGTDAKYIDIRANGRYESIEGVLYDNIEKALVRYPANSDNDQYVVPEGIEIIEEDAFRGALNLEEILVPSSLKSIGAHAFCYCKNLEKIVLPAGIEDIQEGAFDSCDSLTLYLYQGSYADNLVKATDYTYTYIDSGEEDGTNTEWSECQKETDGYVKDVKIHISQNGYSYVLYTITNPNSYPVYYGMETLFKNENDQVIGTSNNSVTCLGPGQDSVFWALNEEPFASASYKWEIKKSNLYPAGDAMSVSEIRSGNKYVFTIKNTSSRTIRCPEASIVFYDEEGNVIDRSHTSFAMSFGPGEEEYVEFYCQNDSAQYQLYLDGYFKG